MAVYLDNLYRKIRESGMSMCELARKAGLSDNTIYNWFNARQSQPTVEALKNVCDVLGISLPSLFSVSGDRLRPAQAEMRELSHDLDDNELAAVNALMCLLRRNKR